jgi:Antitoxin VbhA
MLWVSSTDHQLTSAERERAAANALASVRAEGLDPAGAEPIVSAWKRGEITIDEMVEQTLALAAGRHGEPDQPSAAA